VRINPSSFPRYNQRILHMRALLLATVLLSSSFLRASNTIDAARQLAHKIVAASGPGAFAIEIANRSSLDDKSVREVRSALEGQLQAEGVHSARGEQAAGTIEIVLSESLREYVWTAQISIGSDEEKVALVSLSRPASAAPFASVQPLTLKTALLFAQEQRMLDAALLEMPGGSRLLVLEDDRVAIYRQTGANPASRWELETSLPIAHTRTFPRDLRGRLLLRRDHLFDVYLPGISCRSSAAASLTLTCATTDDPWPLTAEDGGVHAFFASARNFFTGALSPGIGKISNVPSFYSAAAVPRPGYTLWAFATVDGSLHLVDGVTDLAIRGANWGSDLAAVRSGCSQGTELVISENGNTPDRDNLRAFEVPDREPVAASSAVEFDGHIVALWPDAAGVTATAILKRGNTEWYEAYRVSITCGS